MTPDELRRFYSKVRVESSGCWTWTLALSHGYGTLHLHGKRPLAHRLSYEHHVGQIPDGLTLDHLCRNTACVNPAHLEPVTQRENLLRGDTIPAAYAARTHCQNGHPLTEDNLVGGKERVRNGRRCKTCARERMREARARAAA